MTEPLKVVFGGYDAAREIGGVATWLGRLLPALAERGLHPVAHLLRYEEPGPGAIESELVRAGVFCRSAPRPQFIRPATELCLDWLALDRPAVYVPNTLVPGYIAGPSLRRGGRSVVGVLHSDDDFYRGLLERFVTGPIDAVDAVVAVSEWLRRQATARTAAPCPLIPCGVPIPPTSRVHRPGPVRLIWAARMVEQQKQASLTARALCAVAAAVPGVEVVMIGDGPARPSVERIIAQEGQGRVSLTGRVAPADMPARMAEGDALVLLSDYEGLPVALLEGMSAGLVPVCLETRSGIREVLRDDVNGLVVSDRGPALITAVRRLVGNPALRERLGAAARRTVVERYSLDACADAWAKLLRGLAEQRPPAGPFALDRRFRLPRPHPGLAGFDQRPRPLARRVLGRLRRWFGGIHPNTT